MDPADTISFNNDILGRLSKPINISLYFSNDSTHVTIFKKAILNPFEDPCNISLSTVSILQDTIFYQRQPISVSTTWQCIAYATNDILAKVIFVFNFLDDVDLTNIHGAENKRFRGITVNMVFGANVLVLDTWNNVNMPELLTVYYNNSKKGRCEEVSQVPINAIGMFGGKCRNEIIVGSAKQVYKYCIKKDEWTQVQDEIDVVNRRAYAKGCSLKDNFVLCGGILGSRVELMRFNQNIQKKSEIAMKQSSKGQKDLTGNIFTNPEQNNDQQYLMPQTICSTELPIPMTVAHSLTKVSNSSVILTGGGILHSKTSNRAFLGEITQDQTDVIWKEMKPMTKGRKGHVSFKMNTSLYVAGGVLKSCHFLQCCEKYDINEEKWYDAVHALPYSLAGATASASKDESFALIIGGLRVKGEYSKAIITFTEQDGFKTLKDISLIHNKFLGTAITV